MTRLELIEAAREIGREACEAGQRWAPRDDTKLYHLWRSGPTVSMDALADAWSFGWYQALYLAEAAIFDSANPGASTATEW